MAEFSVIEEQGVRYVRILLRDETIRVEAGALATYLGQIAMRARIPSVGALLKSSLSEERPVRPTLTGTGEVILESSVGGFHVFENKGEEWLLERGAFWAADSGIEVGAYRERVLNALFSGDGLIDFCTRIYGAGQVVLATRGPASELRLDPGQVYAAEARGVVIARTADVTYRVRRPARSVIGSIISGERALRSFIGPGRIIVAATAYWGAFLLEKVGARPEAANADRPAPPPPESARAGAPS